MLGTCGRIATAFVPRKVTFAANTYRKEGTKELKVQMSGTAFSDGDMQAWCDWMETNYDVITQGHQDVLVREVNFSNNMLTATGVALLLNLLHSKRLTVRVLKLYQNRIESGTEISEYLLHCRGHLWELHLSHNHLALSDVLDLMMAVAGARHPQGGD